jgi:hypothetical protein
MERTDELRLKQSRIWLKSAKRDYRTYSMEIHTLFFPLIRLTPEEPQDAIYHLAQCVEKLVKATCVSSGLYSEDEVISYGHDTLYLYLDFILKLMDNPLCQLFFDKTEGKIFEQSNAELPNYSEAIRRVIEIQRNAKLESSRRNENIGSRNSQFLQRHFKIQRPCKKLIYKVWIEISVSNLLAITHFSNILNSSNEPEKATSYPECKFCDITKEDCTKRVETEVVGHEGTELPV